MGPLEDIGPYANTMITTQKTDVADNKPGICSVLIGLLLLGPALWVLTFMGLFLWAHIGLIAPVTLIGLMFWACAYSRTHHKSFKLHWNHRLSDDERATIKRRLNG